jgi:uncharacterized membrane protein
MLPNDRAQPAAQNKPSWGHRLMHAYRRAPTWLKITVIAAAVLFFPATLGLILVGALIYAIVSVVQGRRTPGASASVAVWGLAVFFGAYSGNTSWLLSLALMPFVVALAAHARPLARWFIPCRTVAWVLAWSVPAGVIALKAAPGQPFLGTIAAWLLAAAVLGWRVAKGMQDARMYGGRAPGNPRTPGNPRVPADPRAPGSPADQHPAGNGANGPAATRVPRPPGSGRRPRRCPTPTTPPATTRARPGRGRRSRSRTRWPNSTR